MVVRRMLCSVSYIYIVKMIPRCDVHMYFMYGRDFGHRFYNRMFDCVCIILFLHFVIHMA